MKSGDGEHCYNKKRFGHLFKSVGSNLNMFPIIFSGKTCIRPNLNNNGLSIGQNIMVLIFLL